jgi:hypothetical protein
LVSRGLSRGLPLVSRGLPWSHVGLPWSPVGLPWSLPWSPVGLPWSPVVSRGLPWSPVDSPGGSVPSGPPSGPPLGLSLFPAGSPVAGFRRWFSRVAPEWPSAGSPVVVPLVLPWFSRWFSLWSWRAPSTSTRSRVTLDIPMHIADQIVPRFCIVGELARQTYFPQQRKR